MTSIPDGRRRRLAALGHNLRWGLLWALALATGFSAWVLLLAALRGSTTFEHLGMSVWRLMGTYYGAGLLAGTALGLLRPLVRWPLGALGVGVVCGACVYGTIGYALDGHVDLGAAALLGTLVGGAGGIYCWLDEHPRGEGPPWLEALRQPTARTLLAVWAGAGSLAAAAWFIGGRWAGRWPAVLAGLLFFVPLAVAALVTLVALRPWYRRSPPGAA